jgi:hypothetical protein
MKPKTLFVLNSAVTIGYALAFFLAAEPLLAVYGIEPNPEGVFMARWFGVGLLSIGLITWRTRDTAAAAAGRAIAAALVVSYSSGVILAVWGTLFGPFNRLGWIAVGFNALLGVAMGTIGFAKPKNAQPSHA